MYGGDGCLFQGVVVDAGDFEVMGEIVGHVLSLHVLKVMPGDHP